MIKEDKTLKDRLVPFKLPVRYIQLAKKLTIKGENRRELLDLMARFLKEKDPQTETENILCEKIIIFLWKLQRAGTIERNLLNQQNEIPDYSSTDWTPDELRQRVRNIKKVNFKGPEIQYIVQYQLELEKGLQRAIRRLREEQSIKGTMQNHGK